MGKQTTKKENVNFKSVHHSPCFPPLFSFQLSNLILGHSISLSGYSLGISIVYTEGVFGTDSTNFRSSKGLQIWAFRWVGLYQVLSYLQEVATSRSSFSSINNFSDLLQLILNFLRKLYDNPCSSISNSESKEMFILLTVYTPIMK